MASAAMKFNRSVAVPGRGLCSLAPPWSWRPPSGGEQLRKARVALRAMGTYDLAGMRPGCGGQFVFQVGRASEITQATSILQKGKLRLQERRRQLTQGHSMSDRIVRPRLQFSWVEPSALSYPLVVSESPS